MFKESVDEGKGHGIDSAKVYLAKVCKIEFPGNSPEWLEIKNCQELRNSIVHNHGALGGHAKRKALIEQFAKKRPLNINDATKEITFDRDFCEQFLNVSGRFLEMVRRAILKWDKEVPGPIP
jgi:hypothetical protein